MIPLLIAIIIVLVILIVALFLRGQGSTQDAQILQATLNQIAQQQDQQLQHTTNLVLQQLNQHQQSQERTSSVMHTRLDHATRVVSEVQSKLSQLEEANKQIFTLGKDISSLQKILQAPKLRGNMGEVWLKELIGQILPHNNYQMQYTFKTGEICDAVIFLRDGMLLSVDSKFSLENFVKMMDADDEQRLPFKKAFASDTKKRIDEISKKYILPHEGTLGFAFMYVPAENVYYQAFIQEDTELSLLNYAFSKQVIPVSPSSFYAYLQVILLGLKGMEIEKSAKEIQKNLSGLKGEFDRFQETYEKVGSHLRHAQASYDQTEKRLGNIEHKFENLAISEQQVIEAASTTNE